MLVPITSPSSSRITSTSAGRKRGCGKPLELFASPPLNETLGGLVKLVSIELPDPITREVSPTKAKPSKFQSSLAFAAAAIANTSIEGASGSSGSSW